MSAPTPARELIITRGLPGAGKSTRAMAWVAADPQHRARVGRDTLRKHVFGVMPLLPPAGEAELTRLQQRMIRALLLTRSVVVDDTNLPDQRITGWARFARRHRVQLVVWDLRDVPLETCIARDAARGAGGGRLVGEAIIRAIAARGSATWEATPERASTLPAPGTPAQVEHPQVRRPAAVRHR